MAVYLELSKSMMTYFANMTFVWKVGHVVVGAGCRCAFSADVPKTSGGYVESGGILEKMHGKDRLGT